MKKAFTLIELLVLMAITAILAAMLMPALSCAGGKQRMQGCKGNCHNIGLALAMYRNDYNTFPNYTTGSGAPAVVTCADANNQNLGVLYPEYVEAIQTFDCPRGPTNLSVYTAGTTTTCPTVTNADYLIDDVISSVANGSRVVYADIKLNHKDGSNALFKDAHVGWIPMVRTAYPNPELSAEDVDIYTLGGPGGAVPVPLTINDASLMQLG